MDGVIAAPVEALCLGPDQLELVEIRPVEAIQVNVDELRETTSEVEWNLKEMVSVGTPPSPQMASFEQGIGYCNLA